MLALPFPSIDPTLFTVGPFSMFGIELGPFGLRWYALAYIGGLLLGRVYVNKMLSAKARWPSGKPPVPVEETENLLIWMTLGVIFGGRLGYVLFYSPHLLTDPGGVLAMWKGGMSFHGGMLGVVVSVIFYAQRHKVSLFSLGDAIAIAAPIGLFFGRLANFINGELWGRVSDVPWAVIFPQVELYARAYPELANTIGQGRHPSQLYEAALEGLVLFLVLGYLAWRSDALKRPGTLIGTFLVGYGIARAFCEFFRMPDVGIGFDLDFIGMGISRGQLLCLPMIIAGLLFLKNAQGTQSTEITSRS